MSIEGASFAFTSLEGKRIYKTDGGRYFYRRQGKRVYVKNPKPEEKRRSPRKSGRSNAVAFRDSEGHAIHIGERGGYYYMKNGRKVYVKNTRSDEYQRRRRSQPTTGWRERGPKRGTERHKLRENCGSRCFLLPKEEKFPICKACSKNRCDCEPDCRALAAAYVRAKQWDYPEVAKKAKRLRDTYC